MKRTKYIFILILVISVHGAFAQDHLNQYLAIAAENNPALKAKFSEYMAALERVPQVGALPDPSITFAYFIQPIETRLGPQQVKIGATQMFPWFGTLSAREGSEESIAKAKYELFEDAKSKLFYDVKSTYYNIFFIQKAIAIMEENIDILNSFKNLANIKLESGTVSAVDAYRIEMEINDLGNQLAEMNDKLGVLQVAFNKLLNTDAQQTIQVDDSLPGLLLSSKSAALDTILVSNKVLNSFSYELSALDYQHKAAVKDGLPQISLGIEYTFIGEGSSTMDNAGQDAIMFPKVGITVPLYRKKYKARIQEVVYMQEAKSFEEVNKRNALITLFEGTWKDYLDANRRLDLYDEQTLLAQKSMSILESQYATSSLNFEEILRMERKLLKYGLEYQKALTDRASAIAFIQYLQGK